MSISEEFVHGFVNVNDSVVRYENTCHTKECSQPSTKYVLMLIITESSTINNPWEGKLWALKSLLIIREVCTV
jgi:hypothetical protein